MRKFVGSFSGGKDSMLAIHRAIRSGLEPLELVITYRTDLQKSWFHCVPENVLDDVSTAIDIPIRLIKTDGDHYSENFEEALRQSVTNGAEVCIFGDIDLEEHRTWCTDRCEAVGIEAQFPLWQEKRESLVYEFVDQGFKALITVVDTKRIPEEFLGQSLSRDVALAIAQTGADICGEEGEYHTFVYDGPLFKYPIEINTDHRIKRDGYGLIYIEKKEK